MSVVSIRFNDEEEEIVKNYVKSKGTNLSQYIKNIIFEKMISIVNTLVLRKILFGVVFNNKENVKIEK